MKASPTRVIRRRRRTTTDSAFFKKESQEPGFFAEPSHETFFQPAAATVQRKCAGCEQEEKVQRASDKKEEDKKLHKKELPDKKEEDKKLHKKGDDKKEEDKKLQRKDAGSSSAVPVTTSYITSLGSKGTALPDSAQQFFGERMGYDFSGVRVHTGREAQESASEVNAKAYAIDNNIVFNVGQYDPESYEGRKLLAHELTHVIQQDNEQVVARKGDEAEEESCTDAPVEFEALTTANYSYGAGKMSQKKKKKSEECTDCDDGCVRVTGAYKVPYNVVTKIDLPPVPEGLTPCQKKRVKAAINGPLNDHEKQHVKAYKTFNGTAALPVDYLGCEADLQTHLDGLAADEYTRRKDLADAASAALDPFVVPVDMCCTDKPVKTKNNY